MWFIGDLSGLLLFFPTFVLCFFGTKIISVRAYKYSLKGCSNPFKLRSDCRIPFVLTMLVGAPMIVTTDYIVILQKGIPILSYLSDMFANWSLVLILYFWSCDPLTPAKSRVRQRLERAAAKIKGFFAPMPQPVPVPIPIPSRKQR